MTQRAPLEFNTGGANGAVSSGGNLPSIPLDELPGTIQYAQRVFGNQDIWKHAEGDYRKKFSGDDVAAIARDVAQLRRVSILLEKRIEKLERRR